MNEMRKMTGKRLLSLWLCLVMVLQWVAPVVSLAVDKPTGYKMEVVLNGSTIQYVDNADVYAASDTAFKACDVEDPFGDGAQYFLSDPSATDDLEPKYVFDGWYQNIEGTNKWYFNSDTHNRTEVKDSSVIYAVWTEYFDVTFDVDGGTGSVEKQSIPYNGTLADVAEDISKIVKLGYNLDSWNYDSNGGSNYDSQWNITTGKVTSDLRLKAMWTQYTAYLDTKNGNTINVRYTVNADGTVTLPSSDKLSYDGYEFGYYYYMLDDKEEEFESDSTVIKENTIIYVKWLTPFKVTYDLGGGTYKGESSIIDETPYPTDGSMTVQNQPSTIASDYVLANSSFLGWYTKTDGVFDDDPYDFTSNVTDNLDLYAKWDELFTVTFDLNGGTVAGDTRDVEVTGFKKGETFFVALKVSPSVEQRDGYTFDGWYYTIEENGADVEKKLDPNTTPINDNMTMTARWLYDVTFTILDGDTINSKPSGHTNPITLYDLYGTYTFDELLKEANIKNLQSTSNPEFFYLGDDWYTTNTSGVLSDAAPTTVSGADEFFAKWERLYEVSFSLESGTYGGDSSINPIYVKKGSLIPTADVPDSSKLEYDGYAFESWKHVMSSLNTPVWTFTSDTVESDMLLAVYWVAASEITFYVSGLANDVTPITISIDSTSTMATLQNAINAKISAVNSLFAVSKWYEGSLDGTEVTFGTDLVTDGAEYYGTVGMANSHIVSFDTDEGTVIGDQTITTGGTVTKPNDPEKSGFVFDGWYMDKGCTTPWSFTTTISGPITIYAKWLTAVTVTYNADNGTATTTVDVLQGDTLTKPADPEKSGYIFDYWADTSGTEWNFTTGKVGSTAMTLTAVWAEAVTITFYDGSTKISSQTVKKGTEVAIPTEPTKEDFKFIGWFKEAAFTTAATFPIKVEADTDIYAKYQAVVYRYITFKPAGGTFADGTTVDYKVRVIENDPYEAGMPDVSRENYGFVAWVTDPEDETSVWNPVNPVTADVDVYAFWSEKYTYKVDFNGNGKTLTPTIAEQQFTHETEEDKLYVTKPADPTAASSIFLYWSTGADVKTPYDFSTKVTGNLTLYAQWESTYQVLFSPNGGTIEGEPEDEYIEGSKILEPTIALKGYILVGWFHRQGNTMEDTDPEWIFSTDTVGTSTIVLYAKWEKDPNDPLTSITVKTTPNQLVYSEGDYFDPWGLVLSLNYKLSDSETLTYTSDSGLTFYPSLDTRLTLGTNKVTVYYGDETVDIEITVNESTRFLYGKVVDTGGEVQSGVNVYLQQNGVNLSNFQYRTDETGMYSFEVNDLTPGIYTIYCYQTVNPGYRTRSQTVTVTGYDQPVDNIVLPDGMISASVNNNSSLTVVSVPNMDDLADELSVGEDPLNSIRVAVNLAEATNNNDKAFINAYKVHGETVGHFFDLSLIKYLTYNNSSTSVTVPITSLKETIVKVTIELPEELRNKGSYYVYRMHDGAMDRLTVSGNTDLEKIEWTSSTLTLHVNKFSTYAIAYTEQISSGGSTTGDSEVDGDRFTVSSRKVVNGEEVADGYLGGTFYLSNNYPVEGTSVYLYPTANVGYTIDYVVAVNENGVEVKLLDGGEGSYYFIQGSSPVTLTVAFRSLPIPVSPEGYQGFYDVNEYDWFYDHVLKAAHLGYMVGVDTGIFSPNTGTTRGQIVQILYNLEGKPGASTFSGFPDVYAYDYYAQAVTWAKEVGAVAGYDDGYFRPNQEITREEMAVIFFRYAELSVNVTPIMWPFTVEYGDDFAISTWAKQSVVWCTNKGLFTGKNANLFAPKDVASRAEVATCVLALMDQQVEKVETIF